MIGFSYIDEKTMNNDFEELEKLGYRLSVISTILTAIIVSAIMVAIKMFDS